MKMKRMKRSLWLLFMASALLPVAAQQQDTHAPLALSKIRHYAGPATIEWVDPYLSLLRYSGLGIRYEMTEQRFVNPADPRWSSIGRFSGLAGMSLNPKSTASTNVMALNSAFGLQYHYREYPSLLLLAGGNIDADFSIRQNSRNVNNPANINMATHLNLTLGGTYFVPTRRRTLQINAAWELPIVGALFAPYPGLSYYELYKSKDYLRAIHAVSLHNQQGLKQHITVDIPLKRMVLTAGMRSQWMRYKVSEFTYSEREISFLVGTTFDIARFAGRKSSVPSYFVSPNF